MSGWLDLPVVGTSRRSSRRHRCRTRVIGVLGTEATVRQPYVDDLAAKFASDCTIVGYGSPDLVELAEAKLSGEAIGVQAVKQRRNPMFDRPGGATGSTPSSSPAPISAIEPELGAASRTLSYVHGAEGIARRIVYFTKASHGHETPDRALRLLPGLGTQTRVSVRRSPASGSRP